MNYFEFEMMSDDERENFFNDKSKFKSCNRMFKKKSIKKNRKDGES